MALQDILKKILLDADLEVENIVAELEKEKQRLAESSKVVEAKELQSLEAKTASALVSIEEKTLSMARREKSKMILAAKQAAIKELLQKFQVKLEGLEEADYSKILEKLLSKLTDTEGSIFVPSSRLSITKSLVPTGMTVEADDSVKGGFIFKSKTGAEVDNSFLSLVHSEFKTKLEMYFAAQLKFI